MLAMRNYDPSNLVQAMKQLIGKPVKMIRGETDQLPLSICLSVLGSKEK